MEDKRGWCDHCTHGDHHVCAAQGWDRTGGCSHRHGNEPKR